MESCEISVSFNIISTSTRTYFSPFMYHVPWVNEGEKDVWLRIIQLDLFVVIIILDVCKAFCKQYIIYAI